MNMDQAPKTGSNQGSFSSARQPVRPTPGFSGTNVPANSGTGTSRPPLVRPMPNNNQKIYRLQDLIQQRANLEKQYNEQVEEHETLTTLLIEGQQNNKDAPEI